MAIKLVLGLSGGLDSAVLLHYALASRKIKPAEVMLVTFYYGSKHNPHELLSAEHVRQWMSVPMLNFKTVDLSGVYAKVRSNSALLSPNAVVPKGHYNDETMRQTVVPGRNLMFAAVMAAMAEAEYPGGGAVPVRLWLGVHQGDHYIYPDCRPMFVGSLTGVVDDSTESKVLVEAPFLHKTKRDIVALGLEMGTPFGLTRTCYTDAKLACGECGSCRERLEAFTLNNHQDFIQYQRGE